jgi:glycosyltransferase involved in cell wall biosynthesis
MRLLLFNLATDAEDPILGFATEWIRALASRVDSIHVITMLAGKADLPPNVQVYSVGKEKGYSESRRAVEFYRCLLHVLCDTRIDACFSHMSPIFTILAAPLLRPQRIPVVTWYAHREATTTLRLAQHISTLMVSANTSSYPYATHKLRSLGHGINTSLFSPRISSQHVPLPLVLSVGRISPIKGLTTLIDAIHLLKTRGYPVKCALVGDVPDRDRAYAKSLKHKITALDLLNTVEFISGIPNAQTVHWYHRAFAHVNCAPPDHSIDKAVLEAMACGKPSLSSICGIKDTMGKWADRLIFQHADPLDLAGKIKMLLTSTDAERQAMGIELRQNVVMGHNLDHLADQLVALLSSLRTGRRAAMHKDCPVA